MPREVGAKTKREKRPKRESLPYTRPQPILTPDTIYGDGREELPLDFSSTDLQSQSTFFSKLPLVIREQIFEELWLDFGLSQHLESHNVFIGGRSSKTRYHHTRCVTDHESPDDRGPPPNNYVHTDAQRLRRTDPTFTDGTHPRWKEDCYHCSDAFNCWFDRSNLPWEPIEKGSPYLPLLLTCKQMHLEAYPSLCRSICFVFARHYYVRDCLVKIKLPIMYDVRQMLFMWEFGLSDWVRESWKHIVPALHKLKNLKRLTIWMDYNRRWRNNLPRILLKNPRLSVYFAMVPSHIDLQVSVPLIKLKDDPQDNDGTFHSFVKVSGGLVEGATMEDIIGDISEKDSEE